MQEYVTMEQLISELDIAVNVLTLALMMIGICYMLSGLRIMYLEHRLYVREMEKKGVVLKSRLFKPRKKKAEE